MQRNEHLEKRERKSSVPGIWSLVGGTALLLVTTVVLLSLPDIKRYIKISRM